MTVRVTPALQCLVVVGVLAASGVSSHDAVIHAGTLIDGFSAAPATRSRS